MGAFGRLEEKPAAQARMELERRSSTRCKGGDGATLSPANPPAPPPHMPQEEQLSSWARLQGRKFCSIIRAVFLPTQAITNRTQNRLE